MASAEKDLPATFIPGEKDPVAGSVKMETTENVKWAVKLCQAIYSTPVAANGTLYIASKNGWLWAVSKKAGPNSSAARSQEL